MILGVGSPIIDYIVRVDKSFIEKYPGAIGGMEIVSHQEFENLLNNCPAPDLITAGGSCSNTIKGLARQGFNCALLGVIGQDSSAKEYYRQLESLQITPLFQTSTLPTSTVICLVTPDGQRTCRSYLGASSDIKVELIHKELFVNKRLVHIEGYSLLQNNLTEHVMRLAKEANCLISIDLASFEVVNLHKEKIKHLLAEYVDIAFANIDEAQSLTKEIGSKACQKLASLSKIAIVMQGSDGCIVSNGVKTFEQPTTKVKVVDTTGAGDYFASGFLAAYLQNKPLEECAKQGNLLGSKVVQVLGANLII